MSQCPQSDLLVFHDPPGLFSPLLPTVVVASYKARVGKTALAVPIAERLAFAGLRVLLMTYTTPRRTRGFGSGDSRGWRNRDAAIRTRNPHRDGHPGRKSDRCAVSKGPDRMGLGSFDVAVLDTPPEVKGGSLPGLLVATLDGADGAESCHDASEDPANSDVILARMGGEDPEEWQQNVAVLEEILGRFALDFS